MIAIGDFAACGSYVEGNLRRLARVVVPAALALIYSAPDIVRALLRRGAFDEESARQVSGVLVLYAVGLPAIVFNGIVARLYNALGRNGPKIWLALQFLVTNIVGNLILIGPMATRGLALSSTIAINVHLLLSCYFLVAADRKLRVGRWVYVIGKVLCHRIDTRIGV